MSKKIATITILLLIISIIIGIGIGIGIASTHKSAVAEYHHATVDFAHRSEVRGLAVRGGEHFLVKVHAVAKHQGLRLDV